MLLEGITSDAINSVTSSSDVILNGGEAGVRDRTTAESTDAGGGNNQFCVSHTIFSLLAHRSRRRRRVHHPGSLPMVGAARFDSIFDEIVISSPTASAWRTEGLSLEF